MSKEEEYLDQLLHTMKPVEIKEPAKKRPLIKQQLEKEPDPMETIDFTSQFEDELDSFDDKDFLSELEAELTEDEEDEDISTQEKDDIWSGLNQVMSQEAQPIEQPSEETVDELINKPTDESTNEPSDESSNTQTEQIDESAVESKDYELEIPQENLEEKDVISLIEEDENSGEELDDIAQMLKAQDNNEEIPVDNELNIGSNDEMKEENTETGISEASEPALEEVKDKESQKENNGTKKKSKGSSKKAIKGKKSEKNQEGFLGKLSKLLFGEPEEEIEIPEEGTLNNLTDENKEILAELERTSMKTDKIKQEKEEKKKAAKEKKDAKKKASDEKKKVNAKKKAEKPKKEKVPKVKEHSLPKVPVALIWLMSLSILGLIILATNFGGYRIAVQNARDAYRNQDYLEAYQYIGGQTVKKDDENFYIQCVLMADLTTKWNSYQMYLELDQKEKALDCLIQGVGNYNKNSGRADEVGIAPEYGEVRKNMLSELKSNFGISEEKTLSIYSIRKRQEYTYQLMKVLQ